MKRLLLTLSLLLSPMPATQLRAQAQAPASNSAEADFPQLGRYKAANADFIASGSVARVVFLGDSITDYWGSKAGKWFPYAGWINRGIGGQTTAQLLLRMREDVIALHPKAVVLEGGGNDMRLGFTPQEIRDRLLTMGELAEKHHLEVFVSAMTPTCDCFRPLSGLRTVPRIHELNRLIKDMCVEHGWHFVDTNSPLADAEGRMRRELTTDGVHPNDEGYARLAPVLEASLRKYQ